MVALAETFYYDLLLRLMDAFKQNNEAEIAAISQEVGKFSCSLLEKDLFLEEFQGFVKQANVKTRDGENRRKALLAFFKAMPQDEFNRLLVLLPDAIIQRIFNLCDRTDFLELFRGIIDNELSKIIGENPAKTILIMIKNRSKEEG